jgi:hypothetical protein
MGKKPRIKEYHEPAGGWGAAKATAAVLLESSGFFSRVLPRFTLSKPALHPPARSSVNQFVIDRAWLPEPNLLAICRTRRLRSARSRYFVRDVTVASRAADGWCGYAWAVYR